MKKLKALILLVILGGGVYVGYDYLQKKSNPEVTMTVEDGQELFGRAFLESQQGEMEKAGSYAVSVALNVTDNENNVIPVELENLRGKIDFDYDFRTESKASAEILTQFFLNKATLPNFGFMASLKDKALSFTLTNFDVEAGIFLGLDEFLGSQEEIEMMAEALVGKSQNMKLTNAQYEEIVGAILHAQEDSDLVVNTDEEDAAILQSFVDKKVVKITSAEKTEEGYSLGFEVESGALVSFLNEVAEINDVEADFGNELPMLSQINIVGEVKLDEAKKLSWIGGDILVERSLLDSAQKDLLFSFDYALTEKTDEFALSLVDAVKNTEQAKLEVTVKKN